MKTLLFAGAAFVALSVGQPAHADLPVFDAAAFAKWAEEIGIDKEQLATLIEVWHTATDTLDTAREAYQVATRQLEQLMQTYQAVAHLTQGNALATGLSLLRSPLPSASLLPYAITGRASLGGNWDGWANQYRSNNVLYLPQGATDPAAQRMQWGANSVAQTQGIATENLRALEQRAEELPDIQAKIDESPTLQDLGAVHARLAAETGYAANQQAQATNLLVLQQAQARADTQAQEQVNRQQLDHAKGSICSTLRQLNSSAVSSGCSSSSAVPTTVASQ